MSLLEKIKELNHIFKSSGIIGVRNNIQYEIDKIDEDIEERKQIIRQAKEDLKAIKST